MESIRRYHVLVTFKGHGFRTFYIDSSNFREIIDACFDGYEDANKKTSSTFICVETGQIFAFRPSEVLDVVISEVDIK